jgi:hypothetical protein
MSDTVHQFLHGRLVAAEAALEAAEHDLAMWKSQAEDCMKANKVALAERDRLAEVGSAILYALDNPLLAGGAVWPNSPLHDDLRAALAGVPGEADNKPSRLHPGDAHWMEQSDE